MAVKMIVFDMAGTTVEDNNDVPRMLQKAFQLSDIEIPLKDAGHVMGIPKPTAIKQLLESNKITKELSTDDFINKIHRDFITSIIHFYSTDASVKETPGVTETFLKLKQRGIKVAIDTGFSRDIADVLITRLNWRSNSLIDYSITSDEVERGRPHPDMIFKAMLAAGITDTASVIKVGDTIYDIQQGKAASCGLTVGITSGVFTEEELRKENPDHIIYSIPDLLPIIGN